MTPGTPADLGSRDRLEATVALAMLPVGLVLALGTALAGAAMLLFLVPALILCVAGAAPWSLPAWCLIGGTALVWAAVTSLEIVSAFDWRPVPRVLAVIALVAFATPFPW